MPLPGRNRLRAIGGGIRHPLWWLPDPAAQQDEAYRRVWQNLRTLGEVRDGRHDTGDWRRRGGPFALCCVRVPRDAMGPELDAIRDALSQFPFARIHPDSFLHIPVQEFGFVVEPATRKDELTRDRLDETLDLADRALRDFPRFDIELGPVNSFADAAFLDIHDGGWLSRIHRRLVELMATPPRTVYPYLPHMTIAHYDREAPLGNLPAVLAEWRDLTLGRFTVDAIDVVLVSTSETFPLLEPVRSFPLGTTRATGTIPVRPDPARP